MSTTATTAANPKPERWADVPIVFIEKPIPCCPKCGGLEYVLVRVMGKEADGSRTHRRECRSCDGRYVVVYEPVPALP